MRTDTMQHATLWVCVDCYVTHHGVANEWDTPDREPLSLIDEDSEVSAGMMWEEHECDRPSWDEGECDCETVTFSGAPCDGCGSYLAGSRHALTLWWNE